MDQLKIKVIQKAYKCDALRNRNKYEVRVNIHETYKSGYVRDLSNNIEYIFGGDKLIQMHKPGGGEAGFGRVVDAKNIYAKALSNIDKLSVNSEILQIEDGDKKYEVTKKYDGGSEIYHILDLDVLDYLKGKICCYDNVMFYN